MFIIQQVLQLQIRQLCSYNGPEGPSGSEVQEAPERSLRPQKRPESLGETVSASSEALQAAEADESTIAAGIEGLNPEQNSESTGEVLDGGEDGIDGVGEGEGSEEYPEVVDEYGNVNSEAFVDAIIRQKRDNFTEDEAQQFIDALQELREQEGFSELTLEELEAATERILDGIRSRLGEEAETELIRVEQELENPTILPQRRQELEGQREGLNNTIAYHRGNSDWEQLSTPERDSSGKYRSFPAETNPRTGVTQCSRTARLNLGQMGVPNAAGGGSAREAFNSYGGGADISFPSVSSDAEVADVYLDASPQNAQYGHRAAAFKDGGQWFVLDPYFSIPGHPDRRSAIPAETYLNHMCGTLGRNFWGAHFPSTNSSSSGAGTLTS